MVNITGIGEIYDGLQFAFGTATTTLIVIGLGLLLLLFLVGFNPWMAALFLATPILLAAVLALGMPMPVAGITVLILGLAAAIAWNRISQGQR